MSPAIKTAALAGLAATAAAFAPMAPAALPAVSAHRCPTDRAASGLRMGFFDFAQSKGDGLTFKEWTHKETLKGPKGAGLGGDIEVLFKIGDEEKPTNAFAGQPLSEVAAQAGAVIPYKCKKGECGTCKVMIDGHWTQACQTKIPALGKGEVFQVNIRETSVKSKKASGFYSAASFRDGFLNNAIGVVGFVKEGIAEEDNFKVRMEREKELLAKVAAKKAAKLSN